MLADLIELDSVEALERTITASREHLVILFKHSVTCGTSAQAHDELLEHLTKAQHNAQYAIVIVQTHRDVSDAIAARLDVRHETPQALLVQDGRVVCT